jgi:hypothetical protein
LVLETGGPFPQDVDYFNVLWIVLGNAALIDNQFEFFEVGRPLYGLALESRAFDVFFEFDFLTTAVGEFCDKIWQPADELIALVVIF